MIDDQSWKKKDHREENLIYIQKSRQIMGTIEKLTGIRNNV